MIRFSEEIKQFILENYQGISNAELTEKINKAFGTNIPVKSIKYYKTNHRLNGGITGRFEKGHIPRNSAPIGTEKEAKNGYIYVKVNDIRGAKKNANWVQKQRLIYEKHFGPVPKGHIVISKDGNRKNFDPDNLMLVSKAELLYLNMHGMIDSNKEITESYALVARMMCRVNELKRAKREVEEK